MPADDLVLNVRQVAGYPLSATAPPAASLLMQLAGLGSAYASISPAALVGTALAQGGDMAIGGDLGVLSINGGTAQFSNGAFGLFAAQQASVQELCANFGSINGVPIATANDVAALAASTVSQFNGRTGNVTLWIDDIICAGGAPIFSPRFQGSPRAETPPPTSNSTRLATTEWVTCTIAGLTLEFAPLDSPNFSGVPTAPTATAGSSTGQLATTAFVMSAVSGGTAGVASFNTRTGVVVLTAADLTAVGGALLASPIFTGAPQAPTAAPGTNTNQIATTAYVAAAVAAATAGVSSFNGRTGAVTLTVADVSAVGVASFNGRAGAVALIGNDVSAAGGAMVNSPVFTGVPSAPTAALNTNTTQLATTAYVMNALVGYGGVASFNGRAGAVTLTAADVTGAGGALSASPVFTGTPTAPTATAGTNNTQLATTAFVAAAISSGVAGVASFNGRTGVVSLIANDLSAVGGALLASPAFTGVPIAPTATAGTNSTQLATTAFVGAAITAAASTATPTMNGTASAGVATSWSRGDHVHPTDTSRAAQSALAGYLPIAGGLVTGTQLGAGATNSTAAILGLTGLGPNLTLYYAGLQRTAVIYNQSSQVTSLQHLQATSGAASYAMDQTGTGYVSGNLAVTGNVTQGSDARGKRAITAAEDGIEVVRDLWPKRFARNDTPERIELGFIAQEVEPVLTEAVTEAPLHGRLGLDVTPLVAVLVNAVKQLDARLAALEGGSR
jgi:hypothetical protein